MCFRVCGLWQTARAAHGGAQPPHSFSITMPQVLVNFEVPTALTDWSTVDDVVMGGVSSSRVEHHPDGFAVFEGVVSLENNGGFCSLRSGRLPERPLAAEVFVLHVRGDGKNYKLNLRAEGVFDGVSYQAQFHAPADEWTEVRLPVSEFLPTYRGRPVHGLEPLDPYRTTHITVIIADRQEGPFRLALRSLHCGT